VNEAKVKVLKFRTTETREKLEALLLSLRKSKNPLLERKGDRHERGL